MIAHIKTKIVSVIRKYKSLRSLYNIHLRKQYNKLNLSEAKLKFAENTNNNGSWEDYKKCVKECNCSYEEYMYQFELWNKPYSERIEFMSQASLRLLYNLLLRPEDEDIFWNKANFLHRFDKYIHRDWKNVEELSFTEFKRYIIGKKIIAKPKTAACGEGIFIIQDSGDDETDLKALYTRLRDSYIIEECVENEETIKEFHPTSLNTIRIVTILTSNGVEILGSFIRFGTGGNVVDNGGHEGILAMVDTTTGKVFTDGYDKHGRKYTVHPNSGKEIKGFMIPEYSRFITLCREAAQVVPSVRIVGWDVVLRNDGVVDLIEGNHRPDAYGLQMPNKRGYRTKLTNILKN